MDASNILISLEKIKVSTAKLLTQLKVNRDHHHDDYEEALEEYETCYTEAMVQTVKDMKASIRHINSMIKDDEIHVGNNHLYFSDELASLSEPISHLEDYDLAIDMISASVDEHLVLTRQEFNQYWRDEWSWKKGFEETKAYYIASNMERT